MFNTIKSRFIKEREASALLSSLGIKTPLSKIFLEDFLLFSRCKINEIVNKFFLVEYEFMPEMYLRQPGFTYSASRPFTKNKKRIKRFKESGDWRYIYQNEVDKAFFQHDMTYRRFKELPRRTVSDKVLHNKAFNVAKNPRYDGIKKVLLQWFIFFFDKKSSATHANQFAGNAVTRAWSEALTTQNQSDIENKIISNQQLAEELHQPIIRKFEKRKACSSFKENIWSADLADMQLISKNNIEFFILCYWYL